ncbi:MAG: tRNA 2-selenouridine(34) synthase MnmH [Flavobacteriales bacterium]|nr:tRNA 2-selenouridine(34) synthase MnmH [Flavobacteriales bacterium]
MVRTVQLEEFLGRGYPLIDVRSPGEFSRAHIPGAHSLPLFSDAERALVGTTYKQRGKPEAIRTGLSIVGPKLRDLVDQADKLAPEGVAALHCWRGGQRSASMAWLLDAAGFQEILLLKEGYKRYRGHVLSCLQQSWTLLVVGGYTGSGKTELLQELAELGEQVVDLEELASHKGSAFGGLGLSPQPTTEHFENLLWKRLAELDPSRPIWVEDESQMIGSVKVPDGLFRQLRSSPLLFLEVPLEVRVENLVRSYGNAPIADLANALRRIEKRLGPQHCKAALQALGSGDLGTVAKIALRYYDKAYLHGAASRSEHTVHRVPTARPEARSLIALADRAMLANSDR